MNQYYSHFMGAKFVKLGEHYINVQHIISVGRSTNKDRDGMTEIFLLNGGAKYVDASVDVVMRNIVERVS